MRTVFFSFGMFLGTIASASGSSFDLRYILMKYAMANAKGIRNATVTSRDKYERPEIVLSRQFGAQMISPDSGSNEPHPNTGGMPTAIAYSQTAVSFLMMLSYCQLSRGRSAGAPAIASSHILRYTARTAKARVTPVVIHQTPVKKPPTWNKWKCS